MYGGYMGKCLEVDLTSGAVKTFTIPQETLELYIGNKGLGARLLYDRLAPGTDALSPDNVIIVTSAPLTGTGMPSSNRTNITTKSPATGTILNTNSGGHFSVNLKKAGYDVLVINGKAPRPSLLKVTDEGVSIDSAEDLWGLDTEATQEKLPKGMGNLVIGPAGENLVKFACVMSQERCHGRAGIGAVFGSKNLKAVIAGGNRKPPIADEVKAKEVQKKWREVLKAHPSTGQELPAYGTAVFISRCNEANALPTKNFSSGYYEFGDDISGEALAEKYLVKNKGCYGCPIACGRQVEVNGKKVKGPEYETLGMFGSNILNHDLARINEWNYVCDMLGMDTISAASTLAFMMELGEKGMVSTDLAFGKTDNITQHLEDMAHRRGIGDEMAEGTRSLAAKYGGMDFAMQSKGLELAAYEPRGCVGHGLGYAVSNRGGCHLAGGYMVYMEANGPITVNPTTATGKAGLAILLQTTLEAVSNLGCCNFTVFTMLEPHLLAANAKYDWLAKALSAGFLYSGDIIGAALRLAPGWSMPVKPPLFGMFPQINAHEAVSGQKFTLGKFLELGGRAWNMDHLFNVREGFTSADDTLPDRLTKEVQRMEDPTSVVPLEKMKKRYYLLRGLDTNGVATANTLKKFKIEK